MQIILTEGQYKRLFEARMDGFRVDTLRSCKSFDEMARYCTKMLGEPIGVGSSRVVFQIDDEVVLKLARNDAGIAQNKEEMKIGLHSGLNYVPLAFNGSDEENGIWIISEYVLPAEKDDFRKVFGIKFEDVSAFCRYLELAKNDTFYEKCVRDIFRHYSWCVMGTKLLKEIKLLSDKFESLISDLSRIDNWGMCRRDGKTYMVMLDPGCNEEIYNKFYRLRF
jgi:hypothetical protein